MAGGVSWSVDSSGASDSQSNIEVAFEAIPDCEALRDCVERQ